jgi:hypothetical protein
MDASPMDTSEYSHGTPALPTVAPASPRAGLRGLSPGRRRRLLDLRKPPLRRSARRREGQEQQENSTPSGSPQSRAGRED